MDTLARLARFNAVSYALAASALFLVLHLHLIPALLAGLLVYQLVHKGSVILSNRGMMQYRAKLLLLLVILVVTLAAASLGIVGLIGQLNNGQESLFALLQKMADVLDTGRNHLPLWAQEYVPSNMGEWQNATSEWLRENAGRVRLIGRDAGMFILHVLIGMIIGGLVALGHDPEESLGDRPLAQALRERLIFINGAFKRIVFSQVRISALNTFLTGIFLIAIMPAVGYPLPLTKTMILVTFVAGLLPIIGNLISNTVIFLIALSVSPVAAIGALTFLIVIHKLEYFVNAHIIGTQIRARAWELLLAMMVMEAAFGIAGLVAAPIYYAYLKDELMARGWV